MSETALSPATILYETADHDVISVSAARHAVDAWIAKRCFADSAGDAIVLVADELFTNAVRNTFGLVRLTVDEVDGVVRVAVYDESLRLPNPLLALPGDDRPHGLTVVAATADDWGAAHTTFDGHVGKVVWATLGAT